MDKGALCRYRELTEQETKLIEYLLQYGFPGSESLHQQLQFVRALADTPTTGDPTITLIVESRNKVAPAAVKRNIPIEARGFDLDGMEVNVLLHVREGYLSELEIYRSDSGPTHLPDPSSLRRFDMDREPPLEGFEGWCEEQHGLT